MEIHGVCQEEIQLKVNRNILMVSVDSAGKEILEEIPLPHKVDADGLSKKYKNGILEIRIPKH